MRKLYAVGIAIIMGLILGLAGSQAPALAQATSTFTPSATANFVLPIINVPIVLPTAFMPPLPTAITVHVTPAVNMNPYGLSVPANPIWAWNEALNWTQGIFQVMGWMGNLIFFCFLVVMVLALMSKMKRAIMDQPVGLSVPRKGRKG